MKGVGLELSVEGSGVLSVNLISERPEITFPDETSFSILETGVIFVIDVLASDREVETSDIVPEGDDADSSDNGPKLEPSFRVNVVQSEIRVTLKRSPDGETVRGVFLL